MMVVTFHASRYSSSGLHNSFYPTIRDGSTWSKSGARGEHGDVFLFFNLEKKSKRTFVDV